MRSSALRDPSPRAVLARARRVRRADGRRRGRVGVLRRARRRQRHAHLHRRRAPAAAGRARRRPDVVPARAPRGRRWAACPDATTEISELVLEQGATLVLFSNGAVAGGAAVPDDALDRLAEVARAVLQAPGRPRGRRRRPASRPRSPRGCGVRRAGRTTSPSWSRTAATTALEPLQLDLVAMPAALPGRPPPARQLAGRARHGRAGPGRRDGRRRGGLRERRRARLPGHRARARCRSRAARRRRRRADRDRPRRGHVAPAGPRPGRPGARAADHASARRHAWPCDEERGDDGHPQPPPAPHARRRARPRSSTSRGRPCASTGTVRARWSASAGAVDEIERRAAAHPAAGGQPRRHRRGWSST